MELSVQVTLMEDSVRVIALQAVDPDDQMLSYNVAAPPAQGSAGVNGSSVVYQPRADYFGPDSFTCRAYDGFVFSEPAVIELTIEPVPDAGNLHLRLLALPSGDTEVSLQGEPYAVHVIEASSDLATWSELGRMTASATGQLVIVDPGPRLAQRFYRPRVAP